MNKMVDELGWLGAKVDAMIISANLEMQALEWWKSTQGIKLLGLISSLRFIAISIQVARKGFLELQTELAGEA